MGNVTIERMNNLFWLGRYVGRVSSSIKVFSKFYDQSLDSDKPLDYATVCHKLGIQNIYSSSEDFIARFGFDRMDSNSIISSLYYAYDNAMLLRDEISSDVLSYIHLAMSAMDRTKTSHYPLVELQRTYDDLLAFWGCLDEEISDRNVRNTVKVGKIIEKIDFSLRFESDKDAIIHQLHSLSDRVRTTPLPFNKSAFLHLSALVEESPIDYHEALLQSFKIFS